MSENVFSLTKREQRTIIAIVLALLLVTLVLHLRSLRSEPQHTPVTPSPPPHEQPDDSD